MKWSALVAVAAVTACSSQPVPETAAFHEPTAVVAFSGWTVERPRQANPLPQPYLAVANGRSDDLRIIDLATSKPLMSPGFAFPLSVPTLPRPTYLATSSLRDAGPDLLAVAGVGTTIDVVSTWGDGSGAAASPWAVIPHDFSLDTPSPGTGAEILSMIATPVPDVPAGSPPVAPAQPGKAWLILGFSGATDGLGGKLLVQEFIRGTNGSVDFNGPPQVKNLGVDPVSLAVAPDLFHLYVATPDLITDSSTGAQVLGVAEVDMSGGVAAPWPVRALSAGPPGTQGAPTALVAAAILGERAEDDPDKFGAPALRVYAALDAAGCGTKRPISCGIAVIDPALGGLARDLAVSGPIVPAQPYRTPLFVAAAPLTLSVALPAASGETQQMQCSSAASCQVVMRLVANGERWTPAVGAVGAADGRTYLMDLGRSGPASDVSLINSDASRVQVASAISLTPLQPDGSPAKAGLGLYVQYPPAGQSPALTTDATKMLKAVVVTPGFTRGDTWSLVWQGFLPGLVAGDFVLGFDPTTGNLYLAFQTAMGSKWDVGAYVADPELAIHAADMWPSGDLVQFSLPADQFGTAGNPCALSGGTRYEAVIASILPAATDYPGGALQLTVPTDPTNDPFSILCLRDWLAAQAPGALLVGTDAGVRASGLVLSGVAAGYVGRPLLLTEADVSAGQGAIVNKRFNFAWQDESTLLDPSEELAVARKARRFFYAPDSYVGTGANYPETCADPLADPPIDCDPLRPGVALGLIAGPMCADQPPGSGLQAICPAARMTDLLRDSSLVFTTVSGLSPSSRYPTPTSLPSSAIALDRSQFADGEGIGSVFYVTYRQDAVLAAIPGQTLNISSAIR